MLDGSQTQLLLKIAGIGIVIWLMVRNRLGRRKMGREISVQNLRFNGNAKVKPTQFTGTQSLGAHEDVLKWQVELHDLGRQLKGELDSKMLAVSNLSRQCDLATNRLGELIRLAESVEPVHESLYAKAQQLSRAGWSAEKISMALDMPASDIELLLSPVQANQKHSGERVDRL